MLASLLLVVCASKGGEVAPSIVALSGDPVAIERGRKLFVGTCAGYCHTASGHGMGNAPDLLDCEWRHGGSDEQILAVIRSGVPGTPMLGFAGKLPDVDLLRVVTYLRAASRCKRS